MAHRLLALRQAVAPSCVRSLSYASYQVSQVQRRWLSDKSKTDDDEVLKNVTIEEKIDPATMELDRSQYTEEIKVRMPDMGEGVGKILQWYKTEGDIVQREDVLCDIETPDFTFGMETDDEHVAIMGKILIEAPSGQVPDNAVICTLLHKGKEPVEVEAKKVIDDE